MNPTLIRHIKETYRLRQDMLRAEVSLTLQISAQRCRILCGNLHTGDRHACGRKGRYGVRPGLGHWEGDTQGETALPHTDADHQCLDSHRMDVRIPHDDDQLPIDAHSVNVAVSASDDEGQAQAGTLPSRAFIADAASLPLMEARAVITKQKRQYERTLEKLAQQLPVWPWVESIHGFGALGLAQIVGEAGDLSNYANPAKVWKRFGLAVIGGERQRRVTGDAALEHGYSPERRARVYVIGKFVSIKPNPYRDYYLSEKQRQRALMSDASAAYIDNRALRHMTKRLLRDLWRAWRGQEFAQAA